ncbi:MAG TPA: hypothetical protein VN622_15145 [Clostridia bacterium]|nr:hypothetical protein [Clostridia bacterium]
MLRKVARLSASAEEDGIRRSSSHDSEDFAQLRRVLPIALRPAGAASALPIEAQVLAVAEEFDLLTHDVDRRSALSPAVARTLIARGAGAKFEPAVVDAFLTVFDAGKIVSLQKAAQD